MSSSERSFYSKKFLNGGYWKWNEAQFVVKPEVIKQLDEMNITHDFAVKPQQRFSIIVKCILLKNYHYQKFLGFS